MESVTQRLEAFKTEQLQLLQPIGSWPPVLYHYTSFEAVCSILESGKLRAGSIWKLNDKTEFLYGASVFRAHVDRLWARENDSFVLSYLTEVRLQLDQPNEMDYRVASFCESGDYLGMWRLYGDRGTGLSFGFPLHEAQHWNCFPAKCYYDSSRIDDICKGFLDTLREALVVAKPHAKKSDVNSFVADVLWRASYFALLFKIHVWADEQEWRLILPINEQEFLS